MLSFREMSLIYKMATFTFKGQYQLQTTLNKTCGDCVLIVKKCVRMCDSSMKVEPHMTLLHQLLKVFKGKKISWKHCFSSNTGNHRVQFTTSSNVRHLVLVFIRVRMC